MILDPEFDEDDDRTPEGCPDCYSPCLSEIGKDDNREKLYRCENCKLEFTSP